MKKLGLILAVVMGLQSLPATVGAVYLSELQIAALNSIKAAKHVDHDDSVAINIKYVGAEASAAITILSDGDSIIAYAPQGTADTGFGSDGVGGSYDLSATAYDTMGELCDAIDALGDYECTMIGAKRNDDSSELQYLLDDGSSTTDISVTAGLDIKFDTGGEDLTTVYNYDIRIGITPKTGKRVRLLQCVENSNETGSIVVYGKLRKHENATDGVTRNDTTQVWTTVATTDDTDSTMTLADASKMGIEFAEDEHVVISAGNGTDTQATGNFLSCFWEEK